MKKKPKKKFTPPDIIKKPKNSVDPNSFNNLNISWQLSTIDFDSKWSIDVLNNKIKFDFSEKLLKILGDEQNQVYNQLFDQLTTLNETEFDSLDDFLGKIGQGTGTIDINCIREIINNVKRYYFIDKLLPQLKIYENKTWNEIEQDRSSGQGMHHEIPIEDIIPEAKKRLEELAIDISVLYSLRLNAKFRVYGIRKSGYFQIIWLDPNHEIYKSEKKHT